MPQVSQFYSPQAGLAANDYSATTQLPNVSGATVQTYALQQFDLATVNGVLYCCSDASYGAAVWFRVTGFRNPLVSNSIQTVSGATGTIQPTSPNHVVLVTYAAAACTLTLPTVAAGAPIGTTIIIQKANAGAFKIVVTPDSGSNINGGTTDATQDMVGLNATASTTVSAAATNDIAAVFRRVSATQWRSSAI